MNDARLQRAAACVPLAIGIAVLVGWVAGWPILVTMLPHQVTMKANTAFAFVACGVALYVIDGGPRLRALSRAAAIVAVALALVTLGEYATGAQWGVDQLLIHEPHVGAGTSHPGRMAPNSALNFLLLGTALLLLPATRERVHTLLQGLTLVSLLVTLLAFLGYAYRAHVLVGLFSQTRMAIHTIIAFGALGAGVLSASSKHAWVAEVLSPGVGGRVGRRLMPAAVVVPAAVGLLVLAGHRANLYDAAFGAALTASIEAVSFTLLIWRSVQSLNATERAREMSHVDDLTKLMNRRGFLLGAEHLLGGLVHLEKGSLLLFVDLDGMKDINDVLGHTAGDEALVEAASVLRKAFRGSDVLARLGGDEFAAFAPGAMAHVDVVMARIDDAVREINARPDRLYRLELSVGSTGVESSTREKLPAMLARADAAMYLAKAKRKLDRIASSSRIVLEAPASPHAAGAGGARSTRASIGRSEANE